MVLATARRWPMAVLGVLLLAVVLLLVFLPPGDGPDGSASVELTLEQLTGANMQGATIEEARANLLDAVALLLGNVSLVLVGR